MSYICVRMNLYIHMYIIKCGLSCMMTIVEFLGGIKTGVVLDI